MSNSHKSGGKSGQRNRKAGAELSLKTAEPKNLKPAQQPSPKPAPPPSLKEAQQPVPKAVPPQNANPVQQPSARPVPPQSVKPEPQQEARKQIAAAVASANTLSVDFQAIATAYTNYTKKSFEETKAFVEKLSGVRSLEKAIEIQTEFARQAYETFVTESQKICGLYGDLARQSLKPLESLMADTTRTVH